MPEIELVVLAELTTAPMHVHIDLTYDL